MVNRVDVLPFSHLDLSWLGSQEECLSRANRIITEALRHAEQDPEYTFHLEYVIFVEHYLRAHPDMLPLMQRLVQNGQIELGVVWTGMHGSYQPGENFVRNILYGKRFVQQHFGVDPIGLTMSDLPDHTPQFPQILKQSGIKLMTMTRLGPEKVRLFWWQGLDGSRILTWAVNPAWYESGGYGWSFYRGIDISLKHMEQMGFHRDLEEDLSHCAADIYLIYAGNDLVRPLENLMDNIRAWNEQHAIPLVPSTLKRYYEAVKDTPDLPVLTGEIPCSWAIRESVYAHHFQHEQRASNLLLTAEKLATLAHLLGEQEYPTQRLERCWKGLTIAEDHNYDGQGMRQGDQRKLLERRHALEISGQIAREFLALIAEKVHTPERNSIPIVVFNPLSWTRTDLATSHVTFYWRDVVRRWDLAEEDQLTVPGDDKTNLFFGVPRGSYDWRAQQFILTDELDNLVPYQIIEDYSQESRDLSLVFVARDVPSLGYKTYYIHPIKERELEPTRTKVFYNDEPRLREWVVDNPHLRLTITPGTGCLTLYDKRHHRMVVREARIEVVNHHFASDPACDSQRQHRWGISFSNVQLMESGPVRTRLLLEGMSDYPGIRELEIEVTLYEELSRVDLVITLDASGTDRSTIELSMLTDLCKPIVTYGLPYGANHLNNIMEEAGPREHYGALHLDRESWRKLRLIQGWLDVSEANYGLTIASNRHLFRLEGDTIGVPLLCVTPLASPATSQFSLMPHIGAWQEAKAYQLGLDFNTPLLTHTVNDPVSPKHLPPRQAFVEAFPDHVVVNVLKQAEEGSGIVLRAFEAEGKSTTLNLRFWRPVRRAWRANLLEEPQAEVDLAQVQMQPFELTTFLVEFDN